LRQLSFRVKSWTQLTSFSKNTALRRAISAFHRSGCTEASQPCRYGNPAASFGRLPKTQTGSHPLSHANYDANKQLNIEIIELILYNFTISLSLSVQRSAIRTIHP